MKAKVLSIAMQGDLVPQDPYDDLASVLLEKIIAEKELFIREGKIKEKNHFLRLLVFAWGKGEKERLWNMQ